MGATAARNPSSYLCREVVVRAVDALLRWLQHHPTTVPEPIYLLLTLKRTPVHRFEHSLVLPRSPFPSIFLVSERLPDNLPDDIELLPSSVLRFLPPSARRGLVLVDSRLRIPDKGKAAKGRGKFVPVNLSDPAWVESAREAARCVELRVDAGTCRAVRVGHAAMAQAEVVENLVAAVDAAAACVPRKWWNVRALHLKSPESIALPFHSKPGIGDAAGDGDAGDAKRKAPAVAEQGRVIKRRKSKGT